MNKGEIVFNGEPNEAIAYYFKIKQGASQREGNDSKCLEISEDSQLDKFKIPNSSDYSGKMDVTIEKYYYEINGIEFLEHCEKNDVINIKMLTKTERKIDDVIVGYQIRDKYGNETFGETSLTSNVKQQVMPAGYNMISFSFIWPEIREGDYFITLGIGEGKEVLKQTEQCWINNAIHLNVTTRGKTIFGVFNNPMENYVITPFDL